jgi:hypothetical protein
VVDNLYDYKAADQKLALGMAVYACWTDEGFHHRGKAVVVKLGKKSVTVRLCRPERDAVKPPASKQVELPRFSDQTRWSMRNCVWPLGMISCLRG